MTAGEARRESGWAGQRQRLRLSHLHADDSVASVCTDHGGVRAKQLSAQAKHREAGLPMSPIALAYLTPRLDIQYAFDRLLDDCAGTATSRSSTTRKRRDARHLPVWLRADAALSGRDAVEIEEKLRRKLRAACSRVRGGDWQRLFNAYDTDGSGDLSYIELHRALRRDGGVRESAVSDAEIQSLFEHVDSDGDGKVSAHEFQRHLFMSKKEFAEHRARQHKAQNSAVIEDESLTRGFLSEYVCLHRCVLREGASLSSRKVGFLTKGEVVAVVASQKNRLRCVRLRYEFGGKIGRQLPHGWASQYATGGSGIELLQLLPRQEWSDSKFCALAVATRLAERNSARVMAKSWSRWQNHGFADISDNAGRAANIAARSCVNEREAQQLVEGLSVRPRELWVGWLRDHWRHRQREVAPSAETLRERKEECLRWQRDPEHHHCFWTQRRGRERAAQELPCRWTGWSNHHEDLKLSQIDRDNDGLINRSELEGLLYNHGLRCDARTLDALFKQFDIDGSGTLDREEFEHGIIPVLQAELAATSEHESTAVCSETINGTTYVRGREQVNSTAPAAAGELDTQRNVTDGSHIVSVAMSEDTACAATKIASVSMQVATDRPSVPSVETFVPRPPVAPANSSNRDGKLRTPSIDAVLLRRRRQIQKRQHVTQHHQQHNDDPKQRTLQKADKETTHPQQPDSPHAVEDEDHATIARAVERLQLAGIDMRASMDTSANEISTELRTVSHSSQSEQTTTSTNLSKERLSCQKPLDSTKTEETGLE